MKNKKYVVVGKGVPRSVGLSYYNSAVKYADYFAKRGGKPRIIEVEEEKLRQRAIKQYHNTPGWFAKEKKLVKDLNSKPKFYGFKKKK